MLLVMTGTIILPTRENNGILKRIKISEIGMNLAGAFSACL